MDQNWIVCSVNEIDLRLLWHVYGASSLFQFCCCHGLALICSPQITRMFFVPTNEKGLLLYLWTDCLRTHFGLGLRSSEILETSVYLILRRCVSFISHITRAWDFFYGNFPYLRPSQIFAATKHRHWNWTVYVLFAALYHMQRLHCDPLCIYQMGIARAHDMLWYASNKNNNSKNSFLSCASMHHVMPLCV